MMLAHSFNVLGLFLSLCIFASATPLDIDIVTSSPAALERRVPVGQKRICPPDTVWNRRECTPALNPGAWRDVCMYGRSRPELIPYPYTIEGQCPENHLCLPKPRDSDGDRSIICLPQADPKRKQQKVDEAQTGTSRLVTAGPGNHNYEEELDAVLNYDMSDASVWAQFFSTAWSYVVAPNNIIVGKIQGKEITVCKGDKSDPVKARTCYPTGSHNFKKGEKVNFTYGLSNGQSGYLHYAVIPQNVIIHDELR